MKALVVALTLLLSAPSSAHAVSEGLRFKMGQSIPGDIVYIAQGCVTEDASVVKTFTSLVEQGRQGTYTALMQSGKFPCFGATRHKRYGVLRTKVELVEKYWKFKIAKGGVWRVWRVRDEHGTIAFTWLLIPGTPI